MRLLRALGLTLVWTAIVTGCTSSADKNNAAKEKKAAEEKGSPPAQEATIFAAASTQEAVEAIVAEFERLNPDVKIHASFASSSTLAEQIGSGAPADLFLSASRQWADALAKKTLAADEYDLLGNQLVAIVPADATWEVGQPTDLAKDEIQHIAIGEPDSVPAGIYAKEALTKLDLWEPLRDRLVPGNDVRHALAMVEEGAVEAGIVYATDAAISDKVKVAFPFASELTEPIVYPLVLTKRGVKSSAARELYHFLQSTAAAKIFRQAGFRVQQKTGVQ
ncbi:MAG TPA: molybdate ABC transporter substrate-binding protein [Pirellulales bacterium]|nr:molybdate ABC transporter substrate-binding protein [Pirellulales bacterium]